MKKLLCVLILLLTVLPLHAQYARRIVPLPALPANCNQLNGEVVYLTTGVGSPGLYVCTMTNTWKPAGPTPNQFLINQGILTGSFPFINQIATWNNGAVTFDNFFSNITNTASNVASRLMNLQVGGVSQFTIGLNGSVSINGQYNSTQGTITTSQPFINHTATWNAGGVTFTNIFSNVTDTASAAASRLLDLQIGGASKFYVDKVGVIYVAASGGFKFTGKTQMTSSADSRIGFINSAGTDFAALTLGPEAVTNPRLAVSAALGGQTQGFIILKGDGTALVFADLNAAATNGSIIYCSDCQKATPCAGAGNGAIAKRLNGAWDCN